MGTAASLCPSRVTFEPFLISLTSTMLIIRPDQMKALREASLESFRSRITRHLTVLFPIICGSLTSRELRKAIDVGLERSDARDFHSEIAVSQYIELMFLLGSGFDIDDQLPWAAEVLADPQLDSENERIDRLYSLATEYLVLVVGPKKEYVRAAAERLATSSEAVVAGGTLEQALRDAYPEKATIIGEEGLNRLVEDADNKAQHYGLRSPEATRLMGLLMFMLGSSFDVDPKFPWAAQHLQSDFRKQETTALRNVYRHAMRLLVESYRNDAQPHA